MSKRIPVPSAQLPLGDLRFFHQVISVLRELDFTEEQIAKLRLKAEQEKQENHVRF